MPPPSFPDLFIDYVLRRRPSPVSNPNLLAHTRCYLIGPMENVSSEAGRGWRDRVTEGLSAMSVTVFNPFLKPWVDPVAEDEEARDDLNRWRETGEYDKVAERMKRVRADDLRLCDISDFFVVYLDPTVSSWGTVEEVVTANRMKKPIFVVVEGGKAKAPLWVYGMLPHRYFYDDLDSALDLIRRIDSGEKVIDSDRWRLLRKELR
jgi:hypothetical protein